MSDFELNKDTLESASREDIENYARDNFGLGAEEIYQEASWGEYHGRVIDFLADKVCPVAGMLRAAYGGDGLEGVEEKLNLFSQLDSKFSVEISDSTRTYNEELVTFVDELSVAEELKKKNSSPIINQ